MTSVKAIKVGVGAVIIRDGKILLTKRKGSHGEGTYGSFGGHLEFGESVSDAIRREAMEELGIEVGNIRFVSCTNMRKYDKQYIDISCTADIVSGEPRIMELDKIESVLSGTRWKIFRNRFLNPSASSSTPSKAVNIFLNCNYANGIRGDFCAGGEG